jgi:hypothetical protein
VSGACDATGGAIDTQFIAQDFPARYAPQAQDGMPREGVGRAPDNRLIFVCFRLSLVLPPVSPESLQSTAAAHLGFPQVHVS